MSPDIPKSPKITSLLFLCNVLRKKWVMKLTFYMQIRMKISYKLILWFLMRVWFLKGMVKHSPSSQNSKFAMALQYLKNELRHEVDFLYADEHHSFYKLALFLMEVARHVQITQNRKLLISFCNLKKKCRIYFCVLLRWEIFTYFTGVQSCSLLLVPNTFSLSI